MSDDKKIIQFPNSKNDAGAIKPQHHDEEKKEYTFDAKRKEERVKRAEAILEKLKLARPSEISKLDAKIIAENIGNIYNTYKPKVNPPSVRDIFENAFEGSEIIEAKYKKRSRYFILHSERKKDNSVISKNGSDFASIIKSLYKTINYNNQISSDYYYIFIENAVRGTVFSDEINDHLEESRDLYLPDVIQKIEEKIFKETNIISYFNDIYKRPISIDRKNETQKFSIKKLSLEKYQDAIDDIETIDTDYNEYHGNEYHDLFPSIDVGEIFYEIHVPHFNVKDYENVDELISFMKLNEIDYRKSSSFFAESFFGNPQLKANGKLKSFWESYIIKMGVMPIYDIYGKASMKLFFRMESAPHRSTNDLLLHPTHRKTDSSKDDPYSPTTAYNSLDGNLCHLKYMEDKSIISFGNIDENCGNSDGFSLGRLYPKGYLYELDMADIYRIHHANYINSYLINDDSKFAVHLIEDTVKRINNGNCSIFDFGMSSIEIFMKQKIELYSYLQNIDVDGKGIYLHQDFLAKGSVCFLPFFSFDESKYTPLETGTLGEVFFKNISYEENDNIVFSLIKEINYYTESYKSFISKNNKSFFDNLSNKGIY